MSLTSSDAKPAANRVGCPTSHISFRDSKRDVPFNKCLSASSYLTGGRQAPPYISTTLRVNQLDLVHGGFPKCGVEQVYENSNTCRSGLIKDL